MNRALREGWQIDKEAFQSVPQEMLSIVKDKSESARSRTSAAKVLVQMHGQNLSGDPIVHDHQHRLITPDERTARVIAALSEAVAGLDTELAGLDAEIERRGLVIDVASAPGSGEPVADGPREPDGKPD